MSKKFDDPDFKRIANLVDKLWLITHPESREAPLYSELHEIIETIRFYIIKIEEEGGN